jgi:hypothetical protein
MLYPMDSRRSVALPCLAPYHHDQLHPARLSARSELCCVCVILKIELAVNTRQSALGQMVLNHATQAEGQDCEGCDPASACPTDPHV